MRTLVAAIAILIVCAPSNLLSVWARMRFCYRVFAASAHCHDSQRIRSSRYLFYVLPTLPLACPVGSLTTLCQPNAVVVRAGAERAEHLACLLPFGKSHLSVISMSSCNRVAYPPSQPHVLICHSCAAMICCSGVPLNLLSFGAWG